LQAKGGIGELAIVSNFGGLETLEINQDAAPLCRARDAGFRENAAASQVSA